MALTESLPFKKQKKTEGKKRKNMVTFSSASLLASGSGRGPEKQTAGRLASKIPSQSLYIGFLSIYINTTLIK